MAAADPSLQAVDTKTSAHSVSLLLLNHFPPLHVPDDCSGRESQRKGFGSPGFTPLPSEKSSSVCSPRRIQSKLQLLSLLADDLDLFPPDEHAHSYHSQILPCNVV